MAADKQGNEKHGQPPGFAPSTMDRNRTALALGSRLESVGGVHSSSAAGRVAAGLDGDEGGRTAGPRLTSKTDTLACSAPDAGPCLVEVCKCFDEIEMMF